MAIRADRLSFGREALPTVTSSRVCKIWALATHERGPGCKYYHRRGVVLGCHVSGASESTFVARGEPGLSIFVKDATGKGSHFISGPRSGGLIAKKIKNQYLLAITTSAPPLEELVYPPQPEEESERPAEE